jgi:hypothetical protein
MDTANLTFFHDLLISMSLPTNSLLKYSRASEQLTNLRSSTHYLHAASIYVMSQGTPQAARNARSRTNSLSTKSDRTSNSATVGPPTSLIPSIGLHIEKQFLHSFVIKLSHYWLPFGIRERRCGAATDTCPKCIQPETVPHLYLCHSRTNWLDQFIDKLTKHLKDAPTTADLRCTIVEGIQKRFLNDESDPTTQLG